MLTFQEIILRLTQFWEQRDCIIHQGHDLEVGAGTFNPATFLRCLGPEPYQTAYVEPSRRPKDGRFGENPNRLHVFHQFQVIVKPSPPDIQSTYLKSLAALDFDLKKHDIRFVHDDWESPTLGAWGLGWEVWCDGMEVTQFTYFQSIGSIPLQPISAELTYGLERLAMFVQNKESIFDVQWNDTLTFRDILHQSEVEWSTYNFTQASFQMWLDHFEDFEKEAKMLIERHLPLVAYDFVMKASHAFNILDARGAISVTERTGYIARIRELSRIVAMEYVCMREKMGFPLLRPDKKKTAHKSPRSTKPIPFHPQKRRDFLLEIGSEQLPATFVPIGCENLEKALRCFLKEHNLDYETVHTYGTPQRLAILVKGLVEGTPPQSLERKGPALSAAFHSDGKPTAQGEGFLKAMGHPSLSLSDIRKGKAKELKIGKIKDVEYLFAIREERGKATFNLLAESLPHLITNLDFPKKMRWGDGDITYARPLRWIVALWGEKVIPFQVGDLTSDHFSYGHAQLKPQKFSLKSPRVYISTLKKHYVLADIEERKKVIYQQLKKMEKKLKGFILEENKVLAQVLHLTEWPQLTYASFDADYLKAPKEVLVSEMVEHQKYFPLANRHGKLKNLFLITADNTPNDLIRKGNQKVLSARLADGVFLYEQDLRTPLESFNDKLHTMTYQKELGSMWDKVIRIGKIAHLINQHLRIAHEEKVARAAFLCKADLASALVGEFPELQGTIGKYYALAQQEDPEVAHAIEEHWMPRSESGALAHTPVGIVLSIADKLDNLISCYTLGLKPSSSSDPYALRRQAMGILKTLMEAQYSINLKTILEESYTFFPSPTQNPEGRDTLVQEILSFITARAKSVLEDLKYSREEIDASLPTLCSDPYDQLCKIQALHSFRKSGTEFAKLAEVYKRAKGQLQKGESGIFNPALAQEQGEIALLGALDAIDKTWQETLDNRNYAQAFRLLAQLQAPLAHLFDTVKILAEDPILQKNRIALLHKVLAYFDPLVDLRYIQEKNG